MKKFLAAAVLMCTAMILVACGSKNPVTGYKSGDVTLGQYKGLGYSFVSTEVTGDEKEQLKNEFLTDHMLNQDVKDRTDVREGDVVILDYTGVSEGVAFEGGSAVNEELTIGSGRFIDGFEDGLIGVNVGETKDLELTFPESYPADPSLAGKPVTFTCTVKGIYQKVLGEFTDEFVASHSDYEDANAYLTEKVEALKASKESDAEAKKKYEVVSAALANTTFKKDLNKEILDTMNKQIAQYDSIYSQYVGVDAATYYAYIYGMTADQFKEYMAVMAKTNVEYQYMLSAVVEAEKITCTEAEISEYAAKCMSDYGFESLDKMYDSLKENYGVDGKSVLTEQLKLDKALELMLNEAVEQ